MRSELIAEPTVKAYPKLMIHLDGEFVVLFTDQESGTVVHTTGPYEIGHRSAAWSSEMFSDFQGTVRLLGSSS